MVSTITLPRLTETCTLLPSVCCFTWYQVSTSTLPRLTNLYIAAFCVLFHLVVGVYHTLLPVSLPLVHCCLLCAVSPGSDGVYRLYPVSHTCTLLPSVCCFTKVVGVYRLCQVKQHTEGSNVQVVVRRGKVMVDTDHL